MARVDLMLRSSAHTQLHPKCQVSRTNQQSSSLLLLLPLPLPLPLLLLSLSIYLSSTNIPAFQFEMGWRYLLLLFLLSTSVGKPERGGFVSCSASVEDPDPSEISGRFEEDDPGRCCISCSDGIRTVGLGGMAYHVKQIDSARRVMTVVAAAGLERCSWNLTSVTLDAAVPIHMVEKNKKLILLKRWHAQNTTDSFTELDCPEGPRWYYTEEAGAADPEPCDDSVVIPLMQAAVKELNHSRDPAKFGDALEQGFEVQWKPSYRWCNGCLALGDCPPTEQQCSCSDNTHVGSCETRGSKARLKKKLLIAFGSLVFGFLLALLVVFLWLRRQKRSTRSISRKALVRSVSTDPSSLDRDPESLGSFYHTPIFTYEELEEATGGFDSSKELGDGGFGVVYKGYLKDGRVVAVKRLHERNYRRVQQFRNEVEILNRIRHPNLVSLYGCTTRESRELLLVYEYVPNGTLADHLNGPLASKQHLTWPRRLSIAIETASALAYLHATQPQIIHRDVKTSNILLDSSFHVKVADFGLSRLFPSGVATHVTTAPQGTPGYVDPEYHQCYQLTDKSDVYSFGVVLVELISSKPAVDIDRPRSEINLSNIAMAKIPRGLVHELVDPTLGYGTDPEVRRTVDGVAELAFRCLQPEKDMRPSMDEVRDALKQMDGGDRGRRASSPPEGEHQMRDDASLLKSSESGVALSPVTVIGNWVSRSNTNSASH